MRGKSNELPSGFHLVVDDDDLRITHSPGDTSCHVVSFTGIGHGLAGIQTEEFRRSLGDSGERATTYVIDKRRRWFNACHERIAETLAGLSRPGQKTITLGNSMGGFGAFFFASAIPGCTRALAFAPQFSVNPAHMPALETRWRQYREAISPHRLAHALERASPDVDYIAFFGSDEDLDRRHARRMSAVATQHTHIFEVAGATHAVAGQIKRAGALQPLLDLLLAPDAFDPQAVLRLLRAHGLRVWLRRLPVKELAAAPPTG